MSRIYKVITAFACAALIAGCGGNSGNSDTSSKPSSPAAAADAKKVDTATAGTITGKVVLDGTAPANTSIKMLSDPACVAANKGDVMTESYEVDNGTLENVFVYIKDGLGNKYLFDTPTKPVELHQHGCRYEPHVLGLRVGQPLSIVNDDSTLHNVHGMPQTNSEFNYGQPVAGMKTDVTFTAPEVLIPFKCDVHSWMNAYIGVVNHPYFAVTGKGGTFKLETVPPGTYTIEAVHEKLGKQSQTVTLGDKDTKDITFTFKAQ